MNKYQLRDTHACMYTQVWLLWAKSTYGPIIWSLKVFGLIFNSAGEQVCQLLDCLNHIIPLLCILMNVHQAKRCVYVYVCVFQWWWRYVSICMYQSVYVQAFWSACVPLLVRVFGHTSPCSLARLESSLCVAAGHKNNLYLHKVM